MWSDCVYHANCPDGFGAAWAVRRALGDGVAFHPGVSADPVDPARWAGRSVLLVDFCWAPADMAAVAAVAERIRVLDHHASAAAAYRGFDLPNVETTFDMGLSGASLAWREFHPGAPLPELLAYVEDYDLWRHALPGSDAVNLALTSLPMDFGAWDAIDVAELRREGEGIARWMDVQVARIAASAGRVSILGSDVPCANAPRAFVDRLGNRLARGEPFSVVWAISGGRIHVSLRSTPDGLRVDALAAAHGGRGHPHAAVLSAPLGGPAAADLLAILAG